jgi:hypothetical protein
MTVFLKIYSSIAKGKKEKGYEIMTADPGSRAV